MKRTIAIAMLAAIPLLAMTQGCSKNPAGPDADGAGDTRTRSAVYLAGRMHADAYTYDQRIRRYDPATGTYYYQCNPMYYAMHKEITSLEAKYSDDFGTNERDLAIVYTDDRVDMQKERDGFYSGYAPQVWISFANSTLSFVGLKGKCYSVVIKNIE